MRQRRLCLPLIALSLTDGNAVIYPQQTRRSLQSTLQTLDLADRRLQNTRLKVIPHLTIDEIQTIEHESLLRIARRCTLCSVVVCTQFGNEVGRVLSRVDGQSLGDRQQCRGELGDSQLFSRALKTKDVRPSQLEVRSTPTNVVAKFSR